MKFPTSNSSTIISLLFSLSIALSRIGSAISTAYAATQQQHDVDLQEEEERKTDNIRRRKVKVGNNDHHPQQSQGGVVYEETTYRVHYLPTVDALNDDLLGTPSDQYEDVTAYQLSNNMGVTVKAIAKGGSMVELSLDEVNYMWQNIEGATYWGVQNETLGIDPNTFPLKRGLIVFGGVHFAAVSAEHGLYYDSDWDVTIDDENDNEKSITLSIVDSEASRDRAANQVPASHPWSPKGLSGGQYNRADQNSETDFMTKYPVTNMVYSYKISLRQDEDFVRIQPSVKNASPQVHYAEAWLTMMYPITTESTILSRQDLRWRRDNWCFEDRPNMLKWENHAADLSRPLNWPTSCILYDFPQKQGLYHGVVTNPEQGQGVVYATSMHGPQYTKMWTWGSKENFDRQGMIAAMHDPNLDSGAKTGLNLALGRPIGDYYEPWSSGTNFAFFQSSEFEPQTEVSWEIAIIPIPNGLTGSDQEKLLSVVDDYLEERSEALNELQPAKHKNI